VVDLRNEHVFISYPYAFKTSALAIRDKLKEAGFKVWIDVDDMCKYYACFSAFAEKPRDELYII